ncbi:MAG: isoleucine--tRNA ligase [Vampirovibrionales bacterium]|nr:isoleucine--tRNA ligase [Vampirovibrionales bacterium]
MPTQNEPQTPKKAPNPYKDTLNLPKTDFAMRANAAVREPELQAFWDKAQIYETAQQARREAGAARFLLHDGPPYLSAPNIHIGTALNKILKDIVTRYKTLAGCYSPYVPGFDGHGLPIENAVLKKLLEGKKDAPKGQKYGGLEPAEFRGQCRALALENLDAQTVHFKRLGVWGDWVRDADKANRTGPYCTIDGAFEAEQIRLFGKLWEQGYVYKGLKPVYWDPHDQTALAEAEIEYADHESHSIYVKFPVSDEQEFIADAQKPLFEQLKGASFLIWTTTPWTLPANVALCVHPDFDYVVIETAQWGKLIVAQDLVETVTQEAHLEGVEVVSAPFKGKDLEFLAARHPFLARPSVVLNGEHVTADAGTGVVHTAGGHGKEDYEVVQEYFNRLAEFEEDSLSITNPNAAKVYFEMAIFSVMDEKGAFSFNDAINFLKQHKNAYTSAQEKLSGVFYEKGNLIILEWLQENNCLVFQNKFKHSFPHSWRSHKPVMFRATPQWFINVGKAQRQAHQVVNDVKWIPEAGKNRIAGMVENRSDWCISRQRLWGVPIPAFYETDPLTGAEKLLITPESIERIAQKFELHTSDCWWTMSPEELLADDLQKHTNEKLAPAPGGEADVARVLSKETDIMDVWFDSGVTHTAVVAARKDQLGDLPAELYLEGSDQHRGWFQSSLWTSVMAHGQAPYKTVLTHGFVLDEQGRKMSKSLGNVVDPNSVIKDLGADVLRLWVASVDYTKDVKIGKTTISQQTEVYRKVRNTLKFLLGNLNGYNAQKNPLKTLKLSLLDTYLLQKTDELIAQVTEAFDAFEFHRFHHLLQNFCAIELSSLYCDINKDVLYCDSVTSPRRIAVQAVLWRVTDVLMRLLAPVMPHLAEDIFQNLPQALKPSSESIHLLDWPKAEKQDLASQHPFEHVLALREQVNALLEDARKAGHIGSALEAQVVLNLPESHALAAKIHDDAFLTDLATILIVSQVVTQPAQDASGWTIRSENADVIIQAAQGQKCERCWQFQPEVGQDHTHPALCARCVQAV